MGTVMGTTDIAVDAVIITVGAEGVVIITDGTEAVVTVTGRPLLEGSGLTAPCQGHVLLTAGWIALTLRDFQDPVVDRRRPAKMLAVAALFGQFLSLCIATGRLMTRRVFRSARRS